MGETGDEQAIPALFVVAHYDLSGDKAGGLWLRQEAFEAIEKIARRTGKQVELPPKETWRAKKELTFDLLKEAAQCDNAGIRQQAIVRLGQRYHEKRTLDLFLTLLRTDPNLRVRKAAGAAIPWLFSSSGPQDKPLELSRAEREPLFNTLLDMVAGKETPASTQYADAYAILTVAGPYLPDYPRFPEFFQVTCRWVEGRTRGATGRPPCAVMGWTQTSPGSPAISDPGGSSTPAACIATWYGRP